MPRPVKSPRFWMVYCPEGRAPTFRHISRENDEREAERLARQNPGREFNILKSVGGCVAEEPKLRRLKPSSNPDSTPF